MVNIFSRDCYISFLKEVALYLTDKCDNFDGIKVPFLLYICSDIDKFYKFTLELPKVKEELKADLEFFMISDPAINYKDEVIYAYPGYKAIVCYRIAHILFKNDIKLSARILSEISHSLTGIDIHPGAQIKSPFFIDHGTGIVIGETTVIDSYVKLYQGVTLGAYSLANVEAVRGVKRHPTIGKNVTIYSCASILGDITIGSNSIIGANVFLTESVPESMKVSISKPLLIIKEKSR